jgi:hypothetical protein
VFLSNQFCHRLFNLDRKRLREKKNKESNQKDYFYQISFYIGYLEVAAKPITINQPAA